MVVTRHRQEPGLQAFSPRQRAKRHVVRVVDEAPEAQYPDLPAERGDDDTPDTPDQHQ